MPKIFISYRRADSLKDAGRIYDRFAATFGKENVFKDVDSIPIGSDFRGILREAVAKCDVQLVIIGKHWLSIKDDLGQRRLDNPDDFVRIEVESALQRDSCLIIPVLVDNVSMPSADALPLILRELAFKNAAPVRDDPDFHNDVSKVIGKLEAVYGVQTNQNPNTRKTSSYNVNMAIAAFFNAFEEKQWEEARAILAEIRASAKAPKVFKVDEHEQDIWKAIQEEERDREYEALLVMSNRRNPDTERIWTGLQEFWQIYPDHDPENLARFKPKSLPFDLLRAQTSASEIAKQLPLQVTYHIYGTKNDELFSFHEMPQQSPGNKVKSLLIEPFDWCEIPSGKVKLITEDGWSSNYVPKGKDGLIFEIPAFAIAKYPITNAQFAQFIEAGGYKNQQWWTEVGWAQKEAENMPVPRFWQDRMWNGAEQPAVGVSWYASLAFCRWLSEASGEKIMLPTEQQWQRAAQGDDGRVYPWGNNWDPIRCNNNKRDNGKTSPVRQYESNGASPYKVIDMVGNVWEWCLTEYEMGSQSLDGVNDRVVRGGSWNNEIMNDFRLDYRGRAKPENGRNFLGFRIVLNL